MKKKEVISRNYLEKIPMRPDSINWSKDDEGIVTLDIENKGFFNTIAQKFFRKPRVSHIHLDKMGSFVWPLIDGETDIAGIGTLVKEEFGDEANPLYERLAKYFQVLDSYGFVDWKSE